MSSSSYRETVHLRYSRAGLTGYGEGAPIIRYKEFPAEAKQAIEPTSTKSPLAIPPPLLCSSRTSASVSAIISVPLWLP